MIGNNSAMEGLILCLGQGGTGRGGWELEGMGGGCGMGRKRG